MSGIEPTNAASDVAKKVQTYPPILIPARCQRGRSSYGSNGSSENSFARQRSIGGVSSARLSTTKKES